MKHLFGNAQHSIKHGLPLILSPRYFLMAQEIRKKYLEQLHCRQGNLSVATERTCLIMKHMLSFLQRFLAIFVIDNTKKYFLFKTMRPITNILSHMRGFQKTGNISKSLIFLRIVLRLMVQKKYGGILDHAQRIIVIMILLKSYVSHWGLLLIF